MEEKTTNCTCCAEKTSNCSDSAEKTLSCIDCTAKACSCNGNQFPDFCVTREARKDAELVEEVKDLYLSDEENNRLMQAAAEVEISHYCQYTRVQEIMAFAGEMGYKKLGIATCLGLMEESRTLAEVLRFNGFEVYGICCKAGCMKKVDLGLDKKCEGTGINSCNPIMQAKLLEKHGTELNIVMGLCVGHDSLFYKYSAAPVTTLVAKDRVTGHNPVAALYVARSFYSGKLFPKEK